MSGLSLSRKVGETVVIGNDIVVTVSKVKNNRVQVKIKAPSDVTILRGELVSPKKDTASLCRLDP
jgi:carbon storage regulator